MSYANDPGEDQVVAKYDLASMMRAAEINEADAAKAANGTEDRGPWIQVYTGRRFYPFDPRPEEVDIRDIAHALAQQTRFTGHLKHFWSVAQHSVEISKMLEAEFSDDFSRATYSTTADMYARWGLLHDASEAYIADVARPVKHDPRMKFYRDAEKKILAAVAKRFDIPWPEPDIVSYFDKVELGREARDLMGELQPGWEKWVEMAKDAPKIKVYEPMDSQRAELLFMERFNELENRRMPQMRAS